MRNEKYRSLSSKPYGVTYNAAKCKGGWGIYVCALSGQALAELCTLFPGMNLDIDEESETYGQVLFMGTPYPGAARVNSNRIARAPSQKDAIRIIERLKLASPDKQLKLLSKVRMWLINKDKVLVKGRYYQLHRELLGDMVKMGTSQNVDQITGLANAYNEDGTKALAKPTVYRTKVLHPSETEEYWDAERKKIVTPITASMDLKAYDPGGHRGICNPKRGTEALQRISQKRKRTSTVSFYNRWK